LEATKHTIIRSFQYINLMLKATHLSPKYLSFRSKDGILMRKPGTVFE
jgi:hypothetical protein